MIRDAKSSQHLFSDKQLILSARLPNPMAPRFRGGANVASRPGQNMVANEFIRQTSDASTVYHPSSNEMPVDTIDALPGAQAAQQYVTPFQEPGKPLYTQRDYEPYIAQFQGKVVKTEEEVHHWTEPVTAGWLASLEGGKYRQYCVKFMEHAIDGPILLRLNESYLSQVGVESVGERIKLLDHIELRMKRCLTLSSHGWQLQRRCLKQETARLMVPSWGVCLVRMMDFGWADTSEGKGGNAIKDELVQANTSIGLVSTLTWSIAWDLFFGSATACFCHNASTDCVCSTSWDMEGRPLVVFYAFSGMSAFCFMFSTIYSVLQIIMVNEMSDESEVLEFFDLLKADSQLPGIYLFVGMILFSVPVCVYIVYNVNLGLYPGPATTSMEVFSWIVALVALLLTLWGFLYKIPSMIKAVYQAKKSALAKDCEPPSHSFHR